MDCLFCKIAAGEIPAKVVYEDERVVAFEDIAPAAPGHILFITKAHYANVNELSENKEDLEAIFSAIRTFTQEKGLPEDGFRLVSNTGKAAQQSVDHVHLHILSGRDFRWPPG